MVTDGQDPGLGRGVVSVAEAVGGLWTPPLGFDDLDGFWQGNFKKMFFFCNHFSP